MHDILGGEKVVIVTEGKRKKKEKKEERKKEKIAEPKAKQTWKNDRSQHLANADVHVIA